MRLTAAIQEALLALLYFDKNNAPTTAALVDPKLYDPFFSELAEAGATYLTEYGKPPGEHAIDVIQSLCARAPRNAEFYNRIHQSMVATRDGLNHEYVLKSAAAFMRYQKLKRGLSSAITSLERETEEGLVEAERTLSGALKQNFDLFDPGTFLSDAERGLRFLDTELVEAFPTGIPALDERNFGPSRKRLNLFVAPYGKGKSWWLINLAKHALLTGRRVLYVTLELSEEEVCQRIFQSMFSMTKRKEAVSVQRFERDELGRFTALRTTDLKDRPSLKDKNVREFLTAKQRPLKHRAPLLVRQFPHLSVDELGGFLDVLEGRCRFLPDLVIVDYVTLLTTNVNNYRLSIGENAKNLRALGIERNVAMASAAQANRSAASSRWTTGEHTAEDISLLATADVGLTYSQTKAEEELGLARVYVAKGRADKDRFGVLISQAYSIGQFAIDTVGYVSAYWASIEEQHGDSRNDARRAKAHAG